MKTSIALAAWALLVVGCGSSAALSDSSAGGAGGAGSADGAGGAGSCQGDSQGAANADCAADELCQPSVAGCLPAVNDGVCQPRPTECDQVYDPVCGCDEQVYDSPCHARMSGVAVDNDGQCPLPAGTFRCGPTFCELATEYCQQEFEGPSHCKPLPPACSDPGADCACLEGEQCDFGFPSCKGTAEGGFRVRC